MPIILFFSTLYSFFFPFKTKNRTKSVEAGKRYQISFVFLVSVIKAFDGEEIRNEYI